MLPPGVQKYQNTSSKLNVSFQTPVGGWLKLHNHDSSHCILSSLKLEHLLFQARSFTILHRTSSDVIVHAYIDVSFLKLQRYIYTVSIQMHLKWSNLRRGWLMPFFHLICVPGSTRLDSAQQGFAFPPQGTVSVVAARELHSVSDAPSVRITSLSDQYLAVWSQFSSYLIERQWLITFSTHISHVIEMDVQMWLNQYPWS